MQNLQPRTGMKVCNIGIGVGEWDDFLGYWLERSGSLVSIDSDSEICNLLIERQQVEKHPNPSKVICSDVKNLSTMREFFNVVTIIGSTLTEDGSPNEFLLAASSLLKRGGILFLMGSVNETQAALATLGQSTHLLVNRKNYMPDFGEPFDISLLRKN